MSDDNQTCQVPRHERVQAALDHYNEISNQACHWVGLIPEAIRTWGELKEGETVAGLRAIIADLTDADDCWFDHHGYCQAHGWFETEPKCPHARAKEVLAATAAA